VSDLLSQAADGIKAREAQRRVPDAWRISPVDTDGGCEARRLAQDDHPFGGLAVQGSEAQCVNAAWIIEIHGPGNVLHGLRVLPLIRKPLRERVAA
jgi:hypothetical protein